MQCQSIFTYFLVATDVLMQSLLLLKLLIVTFWRRIEVVRSLNKTDRFHSFPKTCSNKCLFFFFCQLKSCIKKYPAKNVFEKIQKPDFKSKVRFGRVLKVFSARSESERICLFWATNNFRHSRLLSHHLQNSILLIYLFFSHLKRTSGSQDINWSRRQLLSQSSKDS